MKNSLYDRKYDLRSVEEDPRFVRCKKEFLIVLIITVLGILLPSLVAYGINYGPVSEYDFILGMPSWTFFACVASVVVAGLVVVFITKFMKDTSLDDVNKNDAKEE